MYVLVAIWLTYGSAEPLVQHRTYADKETCQSAAKRYVTGKVAGEPRAFCLKVRKQ